MNVSGSNSLFMAFIDNESMHSHSVAIIDTNSHVMSWLITLA